MTDQPETYIDPSEIRALRAARKHCHEAARSASALAEQLQERPGFGPKYAAIARRLAGESTSAWSQLNNVINGVADGP